MSKNIHLLLIDPQQDFCHPKGALFVNGAVEDSKRLAKMVKRLSHKLKDVHISLDSHSVFDIAHPSYWLNSEGKHPNPFTPITKSQVENGEWRAYLPKLDARTLKYVTELEATGRYTHFIWPEHCLIGSWGFQIQDDIQEAITQWCKDKPGRIIDFVSKGSNPFTEHFSAVRAEVPDENDPGTQLNANLIKALIEADDILIAGQALSHCVANTVRDIANSFGTDEYVKKLILLRDASSSVGGFEKIGEDFVKELTARGMRISTTEEYLK